MSGLRAGPRNTRGLQPRRQRFLMLLLLIAMLAALVVVVVVASGQRKKGALTDSAYQTLISVSSIVVTLVALGVLYLRLRG